LWRGFGFLESLIEPGPEGRRQFLSQSGDRLRRGYIDPLQLDPILDEVLELMSEDSCPKAIDIKVKSSNDPVDDPDCPVVPVPDPDLWSLPLSPCPWIPSGPLEGIYIRPDEDPQPVVIIDLEESCCQGCILQGFT